MQGTNRSPAMDVQAPSHGGAPRRVLIVAGEHSGERHGAALVRAATALDPQLRFFGVGGDAMRAAGVDARWDAAAMAVVGLREGLGKLPMIWRTFRQIVRAAEREAVCAAVLIDYPGFNVRLAERLSARRIPVLYYIAPQVWAWRRQRLQRIAKCVDRVLVILPFEREVYRQAGIAAHYVGHPAVDQLARVAPRGEARQQLGLAAEATVVALAPGSRAQEVKALLPRFLEAAALVAARHPACRFILPLAGEELRPIVETEVERRGMAVQIELGRAPEVFRACDLLLVASGTATLEAALLGAPMVIAYVVRPSTYWLARRFVKVQDIGLVNLIAGKRIVPEHVQGECTPENLAASILRLFPGTAAADEQRAALAAVAAQLGDPGASQRAAQALIDFLPAEARTTASSKLMLTL